MKRENTKFKVGDIIDIKDDAINYIDFSAEKGVKIAGIHLISTDPKFNLYNVKKNNSSETFLFHEHEMELSKSHTQLIETPEADNSSTHENEQQDRQEQSNTSVKQTNSAPVGTFNDQDINTKEDAQKIALQEISLVSEENLIDKNCRINRVYFKGSFMWAIEQMKAGKKVRVKNWLAKDCYCVSGETGLIYYGDKENNDHFIGELQDFEATNWEIFEEPKQNVFECEYGYTSFIVDNHGSIIDKNNKDSSLISFNGRCKECRLALKKSIKRAEELSNGK